MITLTNPTTANIIDYRISVPRMAEEEGNILIDQDDEPTPPVTGNLISGRRDVNEIESQVKAKLWSLRAGQTASFPDYVAKILLERYGFLKKT